MQKSDTFGAEFLGPQKPNFQNSCSFWAALSRPMFGMAQFLNIMPTWYFLFIRPTGYFLFIGIHRFYHPLYTYMVLLFIRYIQTYVHYYIVCTKLVLALVYCNFLKDMFNNLLLLTNRHIIGFQQILDTIWTSGALLIRPEWKLKFSTNHPDQLGKVSFWYYYYRGKKLFRKNVDISSQIHWKL